MRHFRVRPTAMESSIKPLVTYGYMPAELGQMWAKSKDPQDPLVPLAQMVLQEPQVM
jgi:hypothetical protein